jgi:hypothetical protein
MLYTVVVLLVSFWILGLLVHIGGAFIHLLLILAVIVLLARLIGGRPV